MIKDLLPRGFGLKDLIIPVLLSTLLVVVSQHNFLLFHTLAEMFSIVVAFGIFVVAWHTFSFTRNHFLVYLGCGLLWVAVLDFFHALLYRHLGIFPDWSATPEMATQIWLVARLGEALLFVFAPIFVIKAVQRELLMAIFGIGSVVVALVAIYGGLPTAFVEGKGLTPYKIVVEYVIIGLFAVALALFIRKPLTADRASSRFFIAAIATTILSELAFTVYTDVTATAIVIGHVLKFWAFWMLYLAFIRTSLTKPFTIMTQQSSTYDAVPSATIVVDNKGIIQQVNAAACALAGRPPAALLGESCHTIFHPSNVPRNDCPVCQCIGKEEALTGFEMGFADSGVWWEFTLTPLVIDGAIAGIVHVTMDISAQHYAQDALRASVKKYRDFVENLQGELFFFSYDRTLRFTYVSPSVQQVLGYTQQEFIEDYAQALSQTFKSALSYRYVAMVLEGKQPPVFEIEAKHRSSEIHYLEISQSPVYDTSGKVISVEGIAYDITKRKRAENSLKLTNVQLQLSQQRLSLHIEQTPLAVIEFDADFTIRSWNPSAKRIFGYDESDVLGKPIEIIVGETSVAHIKHMRRGLVMQKKSFQVTQQNRTKKGSCIICEWYNTPLVDEHGVVIGIASLVNDITERELAEAKLLQQANYDTLTNLPNRVLANDRLKQAIRISSRQDHKMALMFVDIDFFKNVNDTLGHAVGDKLLVSIAKRLLSTVREGDTVARMGGDEFIVVLPGLTNAVADVELIAEKILKAIAAPVSLENREFYISASIGITVFPDDGLEPDQLLRNADTAMYRAKADGRNKYQFFTAAMNDFVLRRMEIESQLRFAIERKEMQVHYQPQIDMRTGQVIGAEALLRWHSAHFGDILPRQFIPLAEESGLIVELGEWVTQTACVEAKDWQSLSEHPVRVSVNVSPRQIKDRGFNDKIERILERSQLSPELLELELTESVLLDDEARNYDVLSALTSLGIRLSIDDFGTGYSSLGYLKRYPFTALKIDRMFVTDIDTDANDASLCVAIIALAKSLCLEVIGEGAETERQSRFLRDHGVNIVQGYHLSRPLTSEQFRQFLYERNIEKSEVV